MASDPSLFTTTGGGSPATAELVRITGSPLGLALLIDRPERRNALTLEMWQALGERATELASRTTGPIYLLGAGGYFCSGADLGALEWARSDERHAAEFVEGVVTCLLSLHLLDREVVAVVDGGAAGGGIEIMAACDRRIALGTPRLVFPFGHHGMTLDGFTRWSLTELLGHDEAERLADGRHVVEAEEAHDLGLFDEQYATVDDLVAAEAARVSATTEDRADVGGSVRDRTKHRPSYLLEGEDVPAAVVRAAAPMLTAFPPYRTS